MAQAQVDPENDYSTLRSDADSLFGSVVQKSEPDDSEDSIGRQFESILHKNHQKEQELVSESFKSTKPRRKRERPESRESKLTR